MRSFTPLCYVQDDKYLRGWRMGLVAAKPPPTPSSLKTYEYPVISTEGRPRSSSEAKSREFYRTTMFFYFRSLLVIIFTYKHMCLQIRHINLFFSKKNVPLSFLPSYYALVFYQNTIEIIHLIFTCRRFCMSLHFVHNSLF